MFQNLPELFEKLGSFSFSSLFAYIGLIIGLLLGLLLWFRHLLRFNQTQRQKRRLQAEHKELAAENQSLIERISWYDSRKSALDTMEASVAKEAATKLTKEQKRQPGFNSGSSSTSVDRDRKLPAQGSDSTKFGSASQAAGFSAGQASGQFKWESLEGVTPEMATQLKQMGIKDVKHLESLSPSERESLEAKLAFEGHKWNWNWLTNWKTGAAGLAAGAAGAAAHKASSNSGSAPSGKDTSSASSNKDASSSGRPLRASATASSSLNKNDFVGSAQQGWPSDRPAPFEFTAPQTKGPEVDWASIDGVDPKLAAELQAMGIKNVEQLDSLPKADRERLEAQLKSKGLSWDWDWLTDWKTGIAGLGGTAAGVVGWKTKRKDGSSESELSSAKDSSDFNDSQANSQSDFLKPVRGFAAGVENPKSGSIESDSGFSLELPKVGGPAIDWTSVQGVDADLAAELKALGIKNVDQLEQLSPHQREQLEANMASKGLSWDWSRLGGWKSSAENQATSSNYSVTKSYPTDQNQQGHDSALGHSENHDSASNSSFEGQEGDQHSGSAQSNVSTAVTPAGSKPEFKDDLTLLDGIEGPQAVELQKMGIFNFTQLHNLNLEERAKLQNAFRQRGWHLDMDQWRIASEGNTEHPSIEDIQRKAFEIYQDRDHKGFGGGERTDWEQAEWELRGNPIFSYGVPHDVDDFAVQLTGVTPEARDELYRMGLYNRYQLEQLSHDNRRMLTRWFAGPRFGVDLTQSFGWLGSMDSVPTDRDFGHVFATRPARVDDLSDINGVGGPTEHDLNRIGIYQFDQIANWTAENIIAVNELLNLNGRIDRDKWVTQAQRLMRKS